MTADPGIVNALATTDVFRKLSPRALQRVAAQAVIVRHYPGERIIGEGANSVAFHLITSGLASVSAYAMPRPDLGPGDYFGEISVIDHRPGSATVTAKTELTTISLTAWTFRSILDSEPEVAKALLEVLCARIRAAEIA